MRKINKILIAQITYNIDIDAEKKLEKFLNDDSLADDTENFITVCLASRGIEKDGLITEADVEATSQIITNNGSGGNCHKLFRDQDDAIMGGVLSGLAKYFNVDPIIARLIFIVLFCLLFPSIPLVVVYVLFWLFLPEAKNDYDRLCLHGYDITLKNETMILQKRNNLSSQNDCSNYKNKPSVLTILAVVSGIIGLSSLILVAMSAIFIIFNNLGIIKLAIKQYSICNILMIIGLITMIVFLVVFSKLVRRKIARKIVFIVELVFLLGFSVFCMSYITSSQYKSISQPTLNSNGYQKNNQKIDTKIRND